jgi:hypothetical protein
MFALVACGGGGGGGGGGTSSNLPNIGDLSVSPSSISFEVEAGGALPGTIWSTVEFHDPRVYEVVIGAPGDQSLPAWIDIFLSGSSSPMSLSLRVKNTNLSPGEYTTTVRVATRYVSPNGAAFLDVRDIPVTLNVRPAVTLSASTGTLLLDRNEPAAPGSQSVNIAFSGGTPSSWTASVSYVSGSDWLTVTRSGDALNVQPGSLPPGQYQADIEINYTVGGLTKTSTIPVTYVVNSAITAPGSIAFAIDGSSTVSSLSNAITIGSNTAGGASPDMSWSASVDQPWLTLSPASGVTGGSNNMMLSLVASELEKMGSGSHAATVTITTNAPSVAPRTVPVTLNFNLPTASYVAPYIATAGVPGTAIVRGSGFNSLPNPAVKIGAASAASVTRISDTELRIKYDAITSGSGYPYAQPVHIENALGLQMTRAQLVTVDPTSYATTRIDSPGEKTNVLYNGERKDIYAGNLTNKTLERYRYNGGGWTKSVLSLPGINRSPTQAIAISPDGRLIAAFDNDHLYVVNLATFTVEKTVTFAPRFANWLGSIAFANNGKILAADTNQWSGVQIYDVLTDTTTTSPSQFLLWGPQLIAPVDGSRVLIASAGGGAGMYDATADAFSAPPPSWLGISLHSTNRNASRFITQDNSDGYVIYDLGSNTRVSTLSTVNLVAPTMTRNGAVFYALDTAQKMVRKYDASTATLLGSVSVSDLFSAGHSWLCNMTLSEDEATLIIATETEIKILPVP